MFLVGLTGGIASGKSAVADVWESLGAEVVDADVIAREVVQPGKVGLEKIVQTFGTDVLTDSGELNRKALADIVFRNEEKRSLLESITHPLIKAESQRRFSESNSDIVVYVIPLLVETSSQLPFDFVVTVEAPENAQIERMTTTRGMSPEEAKARINSQATPTQRANVADRILNSNQDLALLLRDARSLFAEISELALEKNESK